MKLSPARKLPLAIASVLPGAFCAAFMSSSFDVVAERFLGSVSPLSTSSTVAFVAVLFGAFVAFGLSLALLALYFILVTSATWLTPQAKAAWLVLMFFGNVLVFPVFSYRFVWRDPEPEGRAQALSS